MSARRRRAAAVVRIGLLGITAAVVAGCSAAAGPQPTPPPGVLTVQLNQFRDNYSTHVIEIQLSNPGPDTITVVRAALRTGSFDGTIGWVSSTDGTAIPPGQTKSLPAQLTSATCPPGPLEPTVDFVLAGSDHVFNESVTDPFGVLARNNSELCLERSASDIAGLELLPTLDPGPQKGLATVTITVKPRGGTGSMTIESIGETTLLAADPGSPWPHGVVIHGIDKDSTLSLRIRPARCDPHAVAEDKVGTLIPLHVTVNGVAGTVKVAAGNALRGSIYDFVTKSCGDG
ncbi:hypothetical protein [Arthrobacter sp. AZCC_0090]|uniref:hypothetical protein n=1 Tax=Arthrobacter sp. AZCC_0090 TaxID=2735881 RepID=UPI001613924C|nr:hypothetical protein [Arthrobacter sp. AZCC_0090]MBB6403041.1 hypothetical protein [Arthrobacter sp. AZCC_0090]